MSSFLVDALERQARERGGVDGLRTADRVWSWAAVHEASRQVAAELTAAGVEPGALVVIAMSRGPEMVFALCGAKLAGAVPAIVDPTDAAQAAATCARLRPVAVLAAGEPIATAARRGTHTWQPRAPLAGLSHLVSTSGTTADGKCIAWSEARARVEATTRAPGSAMPRHGCSGIVVPLCVSLGLQELLRSFAHGCTVALVDEPFPGAMAAIARLRVTGFSCTPAHVELILRGAPAMPPRLRRINISSAPISRERLLAFARHVAPVHVTKSYGLTEIGPVTALRADELDAKGHTVGRPVKDREVIVADARGQPLPAGATGEVVVRFAAAPHDGYFEAPALAGRFTDGVLHTGDRAHFDPDGYLVLEERAAELLKVGGLTVSAPRIEAALRARDVFAEVVIVGVPHPRFGEVPAAVSTPRAGERGPAAIARLAASLLRAEEVPRWYLARRALPRTPSGKLRRGVVAAEAARWVAWWPSAIARGSEVLPARALVTPGADLLVVDGWRARLPAWAGTAPADPGARRLAVTAADGARLVAVAWIRDGVDAASSGVRLIDGPRIAPRWRAAGLEVHLIAALVDAALRLPGAPADALVAHAGTAAAAAAWRALGFGLLEAGPWWLRLERDQALTRWRLPRPARATSLVRSLAARLLTR